MSVQREPYSEDLLENLIFSLALDADILKVY